MWLRSCFTLPDSIMSCGGVTQFMVDVITDHDIGGGEILCSSVK